MMDDWSYAFVQHWLASHRSSPAATRVVHLGPAPQGGESPIHREQDATLHTPADIDAALAGHQAHSLDLIVGFGVLKQFPCQAALMRRLSVLLKHGGRLLLSSDHPHLKNWTARQRSSQNGRWLKNKVEALLQRRPLAYYEQAAANGLQVMQILRSGRSLARPRGAEPAPDLTSAGVAALGVFVDFRRRDPSAFLQT